MALRELVEGECGAANPLVQWSSHFQQGKTLSHGGGGVEGDRLRDLAVSFQTTPQRSSDSLLLVLSLCLYPQRHRDQGQLENEVISQEL